MREIEFRTFTKHFVLYKIQNVHDKKKKKERSRDLGLSPLSPIPQIKPFPSA